MFRLIGYLLAIVILISVLRSVIGLVARLFSEWIGTPAKSVGHVPPSPPGPVSGELKKDPVCGTYIAADTSVKKRIGDHVVHFCSEACRDKYHA